MEQYQAVMADIFRYGRPVKPRNQKTMEICGHTMVFMPDQWFLDYEPLPLNFKYVAEELKWYIRGHKNDMSIALHAKQWEQCIDANQEIQSNYGFYFNEQMSHVASVINTDADTRRAIMNINRPEHNYLFARDVPCTMYFNFMVRDDALNLHVHMRSQDAVWGLRNDLPAFQMFKLWMSELVDIPPGVLLIMVDSLHIYEKHWSNAADVVKAPNRSTKSFGSMAELKEWTE